MKKFLFLLLVCYIALIELGCNKNGSSGPPLITNVRVLDTTKRDLKVVGASPGSEIVLQGQNLQGAREIYFNDTLAYFNPVYNTSTNLIVVIPSTAQTAATLPSVSNSIRLVTDHGSTNYTFQLILPPPTISGISLDSTGTVIEINGTNLAGIKKITFPVPGNDTALSYTVNKEFTQVIAKIPPGNAFPDSLRVQCLFGTASYTYPPPMIIGSLSNENAAAGTTLLINGVNFIGVSEVLFPGGLQGVNLKTNSVNQLSVEVPPGITAPGSVSISGQLGTATAPQPFDTYLTFTSPGYLSTFEQQWAGDNTSFLGWTGGYADGPTTTANYPGGTGAAGVIVQASPMPANSAAGSQGNGGFLQLNDVPWVGDKSQSVNNYSLKFEVYVASTWSAGEIWIAVGDWYTWSSYTARFAPWETAPNGKYKPSGWVTVTIPLTQMIQGNQFYQTAWNPNGAPAKTFNDYPTTGVCFMVMNDQGSAVPANSINIAVDNVRIVQGK
ncbi:MAG TPA: glycan-binding surface protein [Puia sp.]|nr:glycan-binding surface protein [Puia sp.]